MKIRYQLQAYLDANDMNASQLARKAGIPRQTISDWLGGTTPRNILYVKKVADVLQISIEELCFGEKKQNIPHEKTAELPHIPTNNDWVSGIFEVKFRRLKR